MEEQITDVNPVESSTTEIEQDVTQEVIQPEETVEIESSTPPVAEAGETIPSDVDDRGVPWQNVAMESKRKLDKTAEELVEIKAMIQQNSQVQQPTERQPTIGELRAFAQQADDVESQKWAYEEIHKLERQESAKLVKEELNNWKEQQKVEKIKVDTFNAVISRNPELAIKDKAGNFAGWNTKSPLYQRMNQYMANPRVSSQPDALDIAEAYAIRDLARQQVPQVAQTINQQKNQISSLQKKTMVEGTGANPQAPISPRKAAIIKSESGTVKDGAVAMKEILKSQGIIKE